LFALSRQYFNPKIKMTKILRLAIRKPVSKTTFLLYFELKQNMATRAKKGLNSAEMTYLQGGKS
jgi:hypothetical protein